MSSETPTPSSNPNMPPDYTAVYTRIAVALEAIEKWLKIIADNMSRYVTGQGC